MAHSPEPGRRPDESQHRADNLDQLTTHRKAQLGAAVWRMLVMASVVVALAAIVLAIYIYRIALG